MPRGRSQIPFYGQCPENEMPHMQRGPCFTDNYGKMDGPCGYVFELSLTSLGYFASVLTMVFAFVLRRMGVSEFKSPMMSADPPPAPPKKKRRTSNTMASAAQPPPSPVMQDLLPPPLTGKFGEFCVRINGLTKEPTKR